MANNGQQQQHVSNSINFGDIPKFDANIREFWQEFVPIAEFNSSGDQHKVGLLRIACNKNQDALALLEGVMTLEDAKKKLFDAYDTGNYVDLAKEAIEDCQQGPTEPIAEFRRRFDKRLRNYKDALNSYNQNKGGGEDKIVNIYDNMFTKTETFLSRINDTFRMMARKLYDGTNKFQEVVDAIRKQERIIRKESRRVQATRMILPAQSAASVTPMKTTSPSPSKEEVDDMVNKRVQAEMKAYRTEMQQIHRLNAMHTRHAEHEHNGQGKIGCLRCDSKQHLTNDCDKFCCTCGGNHHHSRCTEDFMAMRCGDCQGKHVTKMCPYRIMGIPDFVQRRIDKRRTPTRQPWSGGPNRKPDHRGKPLKRQAPYRRPHNSRNRRSRSRSRSRSRDRRNDRRRSGRDKEKPTTAALNSVTTPQTPPQQPPAQMSWPMTPPPWAYHPSFMSPMMMSTPPGQSAPVQTISNEVKHQDSATTRSHSSQH